MMIKIENVSFRYRKGAEVFHDLSLNFQSGKIYGLLGLNGTGKTSLLKIVAGLRFPNQGSCTMNGLLNVSRGEKYLGQLFLLPEEFSLPPMTAHAFRRMYAPFYPAFDSVLFERILSDFEIKVQDSMENLSFGTKKKVLIAFALATMVKVVLMDEPTNGLDIPSKKQFRKILAEQITDDRCFIISTHQVRDLGTMLDHLVILHRHSVLLDASVQDISSKMLCSENSEMPVGDNILFVEKNFAGYRVLRLNDLGVDSPVDTELLFNGAMAKPDVVRKVFSLTK